MSDRPSPGDPGLRWWLLDHPREAITSQVGQIEWARRTDGSRVVSFGRGTREGPFIEVSIPLGEECAERLALPVTPEDALVIADELEFLGDHAGAGMIRSALMGNGVRPDLFV